MGEFPSKNITTHARAIELGRRGGETVTPEKKLAAKLRELKKKGLTDESAKRLYEIMTDPALSALDIRLGIDSIQATTPQQKLAIQQVKIQWQKLHHGEKIDLRSQNLNVNVNINWNEVLAKCTISQSSSVKSSESPSTDTN